MKMIITGMRRRRKEIRYVSIVTFISAFFVAGILLFQTIMNGYIMERNYENYGNWILSTSEKPLWHPYLSREGMIRTACEITDREGNPLNLQIGSLDESIQSFGRIELYEGRFPEKDGEIAANLYALARMGLNYDIGQEVNVSWVVQPADPEKGTKAVIETRTYTLTGTVKPFASVWHEQDYSLPELIVTEQEICRFPELHTIYFYELDPSLSQLDTASFVSAMQSEQGTITYNSYVYENQIWGNRSVFDRIVIIMVGIAVTAIAFLLSSYTSGRRSAYYRYRSMGVSRKKLNGIIICECAIACVPAAVWGMAAAYLLGVIVCTVTARILNTQNFFWFDGRSFGYQVLAIGLTLFLAVLAAILRCGDRQLAPGMRMISGKKLPMLRRMSKRSKQYEKALFRRQNALHPFSRMLSIGFSVLTASFLVLCAKQVICAVLDDVKLYQSISDYNILADRQTMYGGLSPYFGLSEEELAYLSELYGVKRISAEIEDNSHWISWDNMEESKWIQALRDRGAADQYMSSFRYYRESDSPQKILDTIAEAYGSELSQEEYEKWQKGELLVLVLNLSVIDYQTGEETVYEDDTLKNGDRVMIGSKDYPDGLVDMPVIVLHADALFDEVTALYGHSGSARIYALASEQFLAKLSGLEESEVKPNMVNIYFNSFASYEATDKMIAELIAQKGFYYFNQSETKRKLLQEHIIRPIAVYGSLFLMTLLIYLVLEKSFTEARADSRKRSCRLLKQVGMTNRMLSCTLIKESIARYAWLFGGLFFGCGMIYYQIYNGEDARVLREEPGMQYYITLTNELSSDSRLYSINQLLCSSHIQWLPVILLVLLIFEVWFNRHYTLKLLRSEGII